jgi:hypothetical protein
MPDWLSETKAHFTRVRDFDLDSLDRTNSLGPMFSFKNAREPAERLLNLYRRVALDALDDLPEQHLRKISEAARTDADKLDGILTFDPAARQNPGLEAQALVAGIEERYKSSFAVLHPWISYSAQRLMDAASMESRMDVAKGLMQARIDAVSDNLNEISDEVLLTLDTVREAAAEQGVSQQAVYFRDQASHHDAAAEKDAVRIVGLGVLLVAYAAGMMVVHQIDWLAPRPGLETFDAVQLALSKFLGFGVLSFMLGVATKSFFSHRHNAVVNRHRHNALLTYRKLVEAGGDQANKDIVLSQAAHCIFAPQGTGYSSQSAQMDAPGTRAIVEMVSKSSAGSS